jgi:Spy/CpxP family protein refolding chaperone
MKHSFLKVAAVAALATGMVFGQNTPPAGQHGGHGGMMGRLSADLNLTDTQKQQAQSIFSAARQAGQPVQDQLRQSRQALAAAVKAGASDAEIDKLASNLGPLMAQSTAIHTKAFAKFYSILTQEQKDKLGDRFNQMMSGMRGGWRGGRGKSAPSAQ